MSLWFLVSVSGAIAMVPLHFVSVEHLQLQERYGQRKGTRIGDILGLISGWGLFSFWIGIWVSPQPRFTILQDPLGRVPVGDSLTTLLHLFVSLLFLGPGAWLAINGVRATTLKAAEIHRAEKIITSGVYSTVRHPQYLGGLLAHAGISFLLSGVYSLLSTPLMILLVYLISRKEEEELVREFGKEYEDYRNKVPMLLPRLER